MPTWPRQQTARLHQMLKQGALSRGKVAARRTLVRYRPLPDAAHAEKIELFVRTHNRHIFLKRMSCNHAIERVAMWSREPSCPQGNCCINWNQGITRAGDSCKKPFFQRRCDG